MANWFKGFSLEEIAGGISAVISGIFVWFKFKSKNDQDKITIARLQIQMQQDLLDANKKLMEENNKLREEVSSLYDLVRDLKDRIIVLERLLKNQELHIK